MELGTNSRKSRVFPDLVSSPMRKTFSFHRYCYHNVWGAVALYFHSKYPTACHQDYTEQCTATHEFGIFTPSLLGIIMVHAQIKKNTFLETSYPESTKFCPDKHKILFSMKQKCQATACAEEQKYSTAHLRTYVANLTFCFFYFF